MIVVKNTLIPFKTINLFGIVFYKEELSDIDLNYQAIRTAQMKEMLYIFFYLWYFIEWLIRLVFSDKSAYRNISFEQEARDYEKNLAYLRWRNHYNWINYLI